MSKIPLPPLPEHLHHPELQKLDAFTREQLLARDLEVVRCVREAVATWYASEGHLLPTWDVDSAIRALEFTHVE